MHKTYYKFDDDNCPYIRLKDTAVKIGSLYCAECKSCIKYGEDDNGDYIICSRINKNIRKKKLEKICNET
jgi:hypothetical protein